jgi:hypothetical protein
VASETTSCDGTNGRSNCASAGRPGSGVPSWCAASQASRQRSSAKRACSTLAECSPRRSSSPARASSSIAPTSARTAASAGDLPLDGEPTTAHHSTSGSDQASVTFTRTPAPHTAATLASTPSAT